MQDFRHVLVTEETVKEKTEAIYWKQGGAVEFLKTWSIAEAAYNERMKREKGLF